MIQEIILKKRHHEELTKDELRQAFYGYLEGTVPDYQMSALLMAICFADMSDQEIFDLTDLFLESGKQLDWSSLSKTIVDKHSTGGVGDKTTLIVAPMVASCHVPVIKMSGRSLGYTGGTIDKLESIPSFRVSLTEEEIKRQVKEIQLVVTSQTVELTPLDKKVYALRDVTGTVESIPLIASSIMSKKIAGGASDIVIDIKVGEGALLKSEADANRLSTLLIKIGAHYHKTVKTLISPMDQPLGKTIGNRLEVLEAIEVLQNRGSKELVSLCLALASHMISLAKGISMTAAKEEAQLTLDSGSAYQKFEQLIKAQGGQLENLKIEAKEYVVTAPISGTIRMIHALKSAEVALALGALRTAKDSVIDPSAGIVFCKEIGQFVKKGEILAKFYTNLPNPTFDLTGIFEIS